MKTAINCYNWLIFKDKQGTTHIFDQEELETIGHTYYKWVQHKDKPGIYYDDEGGVELVSSEWKPKHLYNQAITDTTITNM